MEAKWEVTETYDRAGEHVRFRMSRSSTLEDTLDATGVLAVRGPPRRRRRPRQPRFPHVAILALKSSDFVRRISLSILSTRYISLSSDVELTAAIRPIEHNLVGTPFHPRFVYFFSFSLLLPPSPLSFLLVLLFYFFPFSSPVFAGLRACGRSTYTMLLARRARREPPFLFL